MRARPQAGLWQAARRFLHHSAAKGRFYTNRFYVRKCGSCGFLNSLAVVSCSGCAHALTDADIRLRPIDRVCEASNARRGPADAAPQSIYRCFDFTVAANPAPAAFLHLSVFPNGTFYDIKNFRKSHVPLIARMRDRALDAMRDVLCGRLALPGVSPEVLAALGCAPAGGARAERVLRAAIFGFNYPSAHSHVDMHAVLPPVRSFSPFRAPFYYPLDKVLADLRLFGQVRQYSPAQMRRM